MKTKQYIALAKAIKDRTCPDKMRGLVILKWGFIDDLCTILKEENPKFDKSKFLELVK